MSLRHAEKELNRLGLKNLSQIVSGVRKDLKERTGQEDIEFLQKRSKTQEGSRIQEDIPPFMELKIGGKSVKDLEKALKDEGHRVSDWAMDLLKSKDFTTQPEEQMVTLIKTTVKDMGLKGIATTEQIYQKAEELGFDLCPPEVGPHLRFSYKDQPMDERLVIGMKQISGRRGAPRLFDVVRNVDGSWLYGSWADPDDQWDPSSRFVFASPPKAE